MLHVLWKEWVSHESKYPRATSWRTTRRRSSGPLDDRDSAFFASDWHRPPGSGRLRRAGRLHLRRVAQALPSGSTVFEVAIKVFSRVAQTPRHSPRAPGASPHAPGAFLTTHSDNSS